MSSNQEDYESGEQGDFGLDLFTEQDLVDRLVQSVTDDDLYQVVFWIKRLQEKGWIENINDGHSASTMSPIVAASSKDIQNRNRNLILRVLRAKGGVLPSGDDAVWLELIQPWAIELLEATRDSEHEDEKVVEFLLEANDDEAERWIAYNLSQQDENTHQPQQRSHSLPTAGPSSGRSTSLPSRYTPLTSMSSKFDHQEQQYGSSPQYKPVPPPSARDSSLAPVNESTSSNNLGYIDLTNSRSPSPVPKAEPTEEDSSVLLHHRSASAASTTSRKPSTTPHPTNNSFSKGKGRATETPEITSSARAHLRIDNLPLNYTDQDLSNLFSDCGGLLESSIQDQTLDSSWGLITFKSLLSARHAYAVKIGKVVKGGIRGLQLKIYSSEGEPVEPHVAVSPTATRSEQQQQQTSTSTIGSNGNGNLNGAAGGETGGGERYSMGFSGGSRPNEGGGGTRGPIYSGQDAAFAASNNSNNIYNGGGGVGQPQQQMGNFSHPGPMPFQGRFFPRPRVPYIFTAAELARRVYLGGLPFGISEDEVGRIFSEKAKVKARVLRVKNSPDGSHAFAFVQHPDSITADFAIKCLHGQVYAGHLLQLEHVNELAHRWLFSLTLYGFPPNWEYRDVSDFLISTIGSFTGLRVSKPFNRPLELNVKVELRYETELRWAANELNGLIVQNQQIVAEVDQIGIRKKIERELAFEKLQEKLINPPQPQGQVVGLSSDGGGYNPYDPSGGTTNGYDPNYPGGGGSGSTPIRSRPAPPPPPPPAAKRSKTSTSSSTTTTESSLQPSVLAIQEEEEREESVNPFSPRWMMGG
ncbi:hypothetical protein JCM3765_004695, partial [Sporobolomyces pararoseus]